MKMAGTEKLKSKNRAATGLHFCIIMYSAGPFACFLGYKMRPEPFRAPQTLATVKRHFALLNLEKP